MSSEAIVNRIMENCAVSDVQCVVCQVYYVLYQVYILHCAVCQVYIVLCVRCTICCVSHVHCAVCQVYYVLCQMYIVLCVRCTVCCVLGVHCAVCQVYYMLCQVYSVLVTRKQIPRYVRLHDSVAAGHYECPLSLCVLYQPVSTLCGGHAMATYSAPLIDALTRTDRVDPLTEQMLDVDWRLPRYDVDAELTATNACIMFADGGKSLHHVTAVIVTYFRLEMGEVMSCGFVVATVFVCVTTWITVA